MKYIVLYVVVKIITYTKIFILFTYLSFFKIALADTKIIENGSILVKKLYSEKEETLVVNNSDKIYVCSVIDKVSECVLSRYILD